MDIIIDELIKQYTREYDFYQEVARLCAQQCESALERAGIRNIVTFRAKRPDRLTQKLIARNKRKKYKNVEDVYHDIVDLAGVRIALYFPGDRAEVRKFIGSNFVAIETPKEFPEKTKTPSASYQKIFSGYSATHYRVHLKDDNLANESKRYANSAIEIQVASVLMHAWSEVEHDLVYKPFTGTLSHEEHAVLDEINGLVLAGEIALERLQHAVKRRVSSDNKAFKNHYDLAAFIYDSIPDTMKEPVMGRVDVFLRFIQLSNLSKPKLINKYLKNIDLREEKRPISEQLIDVILGENEALYEMLNQAKSELILHNPYLSSEELYSDNHALRFFMSRWIALETLTRKLAEFVDPKGHPKYKNALFSIRIFGKSFKLHQNELYQIDSIRRIRNKLVHGIESPPSEHLMKAGNYIDHLINNLLNKDVDPDIKNIVNDIKDKFLNKLKVEQVIGLECKPADTFLP